MWALNVSRNQGCVLGSVSSCPLPTARRHRWKLSLEAGQVKNLPAALFHHDVATAPMRFLRVALNAPSDSDHVEMAALVGLDEHSSLNCSRPPNACCGCRRRKATAVSVSRVCRRTLCLSLFCQKRSQGLRLAGCDLHLAMFHSSYRRMMHCTRALC